MRTALVFLLLVSVAHAQNLKSNTPHADRAHARQVLDVYAPEGANDLPVVFWIHGGGWQAGDKTDVQIKPRVFAERGFIFVSTNFRLLPQVEMDVLILHVAEHPDVAAQARRLGAALQKAEISVTVFGAGGTTYVRLSADRGLLNDPAAQELFTFLCPLIAKER